MPGLNTILVTLRSTGPACVTGGGEMEFTLKTNSEADPEGNYVVQYSLLNSAGEEVFADAFGAQQHTFQVVDLPDDTYTIIPSDHQGNTGPQRTFTVACDGRDDCDLRISELVVTGPASATGTGTVSLRVSTSFPPLSLRVTRLSPLPEQSTELATTQPGVLDFTAVPIGQYRLDAQDAHSCKASQLYEVPAPPPVVGCLDEEASNYNPLATQADNSLCRYAPRWFGVWSREGVPVSVPPQGTPAPAFVAADLYCGYPEGHPLAETRPLAFVSAVRATVGPDGVAAFNLAPYLRSELGALSRGTRRLDLNSPAAHTADLYVAFRLRVGGVTVARGYALNSVLSEAELEHIRATTFQPLTPFGMTLPLWSGYPYQVTHIDEDDSGRLGVLVAAEPGVYAVPGLRTVNLPCPRYGLPVAWLAPEGGVGYWVFSGKPAYGDEVGEGQPYTEGGTEELRYSSRAASRQTIEAYSGVFSQRALADGLRTLRRATQAWYQPGGPGTAWVPIVLKGGSYPAYREGRSRYEVTIQFTEALPQLVQGQ